MRGAQVWEEMISPGNPATYPNWLGLPRKRVAEVNNSLQLKGKFFLERRSKHGAPTAPTAGGFLIVSRFSILVEDQVNP